VEKNIPDFLMFELRVSGPSRAVDSLGAVETLRTMSTRSNEARFAQSDKGSHD